MGGRIIFPALVGAGGNRKEDAASRQAVQHPRHEPSGVGEMLDRLEADHHVELV